MDKIKRIPWDGWEIVRYIDSGSYGAVYEIQRETYGYIDKAAMKVISIPHKPSEIKELLEDGSTMAGVKKRLEEDLRKVLGEYDLMRKMNGTSNVVNCDGVEHVAHEDGIGWDIYIKMELLKPLTDTLPESPKKISENTVIKIAEDLCKALVLCKKHGIIHRDIKPSNIFISENGDYKLGDFGIAKTIEQTKGGTVTGTYRYMAPEVFNNKPYGSTVDIYSLGLVLYWLLNERRLPFLPLPPKDVTTSDNEDAKNRRFGGEVLPPPAHGSSWLKAIVLKACAYDPKERFASAQEMLDAIKGQGIINSSERDEDDETIGPEDTDDYDDVTVGPDTDVYDDGSTVRVDVVLPPLPPPPPPWKKILIAGVAAVLVAAIGIFAYAVRDGGFLVSAPKNQELVERANAPAGNISASGESNQNTLDVGAGADFVVYLNPDGTVVAKGNNEYGQCNVGNWTDIKAIDVSTRSTVGLKSDGTVVATGYNEYGQCNVEELTDIKDISATMYCTFGLKSDGTVTFVGGNTYDARDVANWRDIIEISAGTYHAIGLKSDGTVVAVGENYYGQCDVEGWTDIVAVSAGENHTIGLKSNGTVVAAGDNYFGACNVTNWKDVVSVVAASGLTMGLLENGTIVYTGYIPQGMESITSWEDIVVFDVDSIGIDGAIIGVDSNGDFVSWGTNDALVFELNNSALNISDVSAGVYHVVYLKDDGTVVARGNNDYGKCNVEDWTDIKAIDIGYHMTAGLKSDGTVVAIGENKYGECDVESWTDIVDISAATWCTVGLKADGTVVATGNNILNNLDVDSWVDIKKVVAGGKHTVGIKKDGTVVAVGYNGFGQCNVGSWTDIVDISTGFHHTVGVKSDGTVVATGQNTEGQCNVENWKNVVSVVCANNTTIGLVNDGSILMTGTNVINMDELSSWEDIVLLDADNGAAIGVDSKGNLKLFGYYIANA